MTIPTYLPSFVLAGTVATIAAILYGLHLALTYANWPVPERTRTVRGAAFILTGWFVAALAFGNGAYVPGPDGMPTIQYGIVLPVLIGGLLIWRSSTVARIIDAVPQPWLVGVQLYRALGVIFLILYASGRLPGLFAWPAGVGDIAIGRARPRRRRSPMRAPPRKRRLVCRLERTRHSRPHHRGQDRIPHLAVAAPALRRSSRRTSS